MKLASNALAPQLRARSLAAIATYKAGGSFASFDSSVRSADATSAAALLNAEMVKRVFVVLSCRMAFQRAAERSQNSCSVWLDACSASKLHRSICF
jgi:hypothetical protein